MEARRSYTWRRWLPYLSAALLVATVLLGGLANSMLMSFKQVEVADIRAAEDQRLDELVAAVRQGGAASLQSDQVLGLVRNLPYVGMSILVDGEGQVLYSTLPSGLFGPLRSQSLTDGLRKRLASGQLARLLASLPPDALTPGQRLLLQTSYALQAEGEHADIYHYAGRLLTDSEGNPVGAVAVAYERSNLPVPPLYQGLLLGALAALALYWVSLPLWVYLDARARGERAWLWGALALGGNLLGVVTYLLARRTGRGSCPACGRQVSTRDNVCPHCCRPLRPSCPACHEPLEEGWACCPRCGTQTRQA